VLGLCLTRAGAGSAAAAEVGTTNLEVLKQAWRNEKPVREIVRFDLPLISRVYEQMGSAVRAPRVAALHPGAPSLRQPAAAPPHHGARCVAPGVNAASRAAPGVGVARCASQGGSVVWTSPAARPTGPARGVAAGGGAGCRTAEVRVVPAPSSGMALRVTAPTTRCCCLKRHSFPGGGKPFPFPGRGESFFPRPQQLQWRRCGPPRGDGAATLCRRCPRRRLALQSSVREISTRPPRAEGVNAAILCNGKQQPFLCVRFPFYSCSSKFRAIN